MRTHQILRLGLFQLAAGGFSVLLTGVLNRVMNLEMGMPLFTVSLLLGGGHYLGALVAIPLGFASDRYPLFGFRRTSYILLGFLFSLVVLLSAPHVALWMSIEPAWWKSLLGFGIFLLEGVSTFLAGTAYLALVADNNPSERRGFATSIIWTMLMVGIIVTAIGNKIALKNYSFERLTSVFGVVALIGLILALIALPWQEARTHAVKTPSQLPSLQKGLQSMLRNPQARRFALFLTISMFSYFMQDVILEPFGGAVFQLAVDQTADFNTYMGIGLIVGILLGGAQATPRMGKRNTSILGCSILVVGFLMLAGIGLLQRGELVLPVIALIGFGGGLFTVGSVALMMDMTTNQYTGLFVGVWTVVTAFAKGPAALTGGFLHDFFAGIGFSAPLAYGLVFVIEALGLLLSIFILRKVTIPNFKKTSDFGKLSAEMLG